MLGVYMTNDMVNMKILKNPDESTLLISYAIRKIERTEIIDSRYFCFYPSDSINIAQSKKFTLHEIYLMKIYLIKFFVHLVAESPSNTSDSPPSVSPLSSSIVLQREGIVNQPLSAPASPLSSLSSPITQLNLPSPGDCTQDPNWQATKPTVRERNAAMFNNHLMADIIFIVGSPGT